MEIMIPSPGREFDFNDARPLPFLSAPSTPRRFGDYSLSAPSSPARMQEFYSYFNDFANSEERNGVAFDWEEKPGTPKSPKADEINNNDEDDFAFDFSADLERRSLSADELFDGGKIRPLKPPPRLQVEERSPFLSPRSPRSPIAQGKKIIRDAFSPRRKNDANPFATAVENTRNGTETGRGRERVSGSTSSTSRRATRSLSPLRVSDYPWEEEEKQQQQTTKQSELNSRPSFPPSPSSAKGSSKRWSLKDFLLFRSASEGRASNKDSLRKYSNLFRKQEDVKNSSFRSTDSSGSLNLSRRRGQVSAHELHYTMNKAVSEDLRKKTFLPYKQGILGRLAFNPAVHALANGFGTFTR